MRNLRRVTSFPRVAVGIGVGLCGCLPTPKRVVFDPFATPFAVVETRADETACVLPDDGGARWRAVPLPGSPDLRRVAQAPVAPRRLDGEPTGFCVYEWADAQTLPTPEDFARIHAIPDGAVVGTKESPPSRIPDLPDSVSRPLLDTFERLARDIEPVRWRELAKRRLERPTKAVRVAVIDTTPKDLGTPDRSLHGFAVSRIIGSLLCGEGEIDACRDRVRPYLALPMLTARDEDAERGGLYGTFFQLTDALTEALHDWKPRDEHLVINLSLGWDPIKTDENDPKVRAVRRLLERASCMGALILAGAGNRTGTDGPVEPGSFEELEAPDTQRCRELNVKPMPAANPRPDAPASRAVYAPLLHAVGALDSSDQRLMADRRWSQPRLAAFALNVMVPGPPGIPYVGPVTGTSFSTAIVSGIAAAVWSVLPDLSASEVMGVVYEGGIELDGGEKSKRARTEFCLGEHYGPCLGPMTRVHRAYLCGALKVALARATPPGQLDCPPSVARESPRWPAAEKVGSAQICRVPDCGIPYGPPSTQVAGISSHGGFAGCPGCTLRLDPSGLSGTLSGIPTAPDPMPAAGVIVSLVLNVAARKLPATPFSISPVPGFGVQMGVPAMSLPSRTSGATLTWYYSHGDFSEADPPVDVQVVTTP